MNPLEKTEEIAKVRSYIEQIKAEIEMAGNELCLNVNEAQSPIVSAKIA